jgi:hypothetical protein
MNEDLPPAPIVTRGIFSPCHVISLEVNARDFNLSQLWWRSLGLSLPNFAQ